MATASPPSSSRRDISSRNNNNSNNGGGSFLTKYFLVILFVFACLSLFLNTRFTHAVVEDASIIEHYLESSVISLVVKPLAEAHFPQEVDTASEDTDTGDSDGSENEEGEEVDGGGDNNQNVEEKEDNGKDNGTTDQQQQQQQDTSSSNQHLHRLAGLKCEKYGGPSEELAQEMVYWEDIPSDDKYLSPFHNRGSQPTQYMTFEPDQGGWNNIRMAMETNLGMAFAMGRTLVLPPHQRMYLINSGDNGQRKDFSFDHFFHMERISQEHVGLDIISMDEFLERAMTGIFKDSSTGASIFPPQNRTDWNGASQPELGKLKKWLRSSSKVLLWNPEDCLAAFPKSNDPADMQELEEAKKRIEQSGGFPKYQTYIGKPTPVNASAGERMKENMAERKALCLYDQKLQNTPWVHFPVDRSEDIQSRMLVHFYAFLFFQDWKQDLWMKRFIRDHVRYIDEIQCAAARIVHALRQRSQDFDTLHVRRGDFQYTVTRFDPPDIMEMLAQRLQKNATLFIATDERKKSFFDPLREQYDIVFLDDFKHELEGVNTNYYGMIDQLVASRGRIFFGCWFSTFTGYINRLRGYHADDHQTPGYEQGIVPSYYYALKDRFLHMQEFYPVKKSFYAREFPTSWRLIDTGVSDNENKLKKAN